MRLSLLMGQPRYDEFLNASGFKTHPLYIHSFVYPFFLFRQVNSLSFAFLFLCAGIIMNAANLL